MSQNGYLFGDVSVSFENHHNEYFAISIEVKGTNLGFEKTVSEYGASEIVGTFKKSGQQIIPCPPPTEPPAEPCTVEVADYGLIFDWYANAFVQGIYGNGGQLMNLPGYGYGYTESSQLAQDIANWLFANGFVFENVLVYEYFNKPGIFAITITKTNYYFEGISFTPGNRGALLPFKQSNLREVPCFKPPGYPDGENHEGAIQSLENVFAQQSPGNLSYPTSLYRVVFGNGESPLFHSLAYPGSLLRFRISLIYLPRPAK